ncbi:kinase-like domain-containing protein [Butyriboletus roseoflavus]|nr:kinase-like domain-containing protein [Butyriboletus roseoflavus]
MPQLHLPSEKHSSRSSSNSSVITLNSPTLARHRTSGLTSQCLPISPLHQHARPTVNDKLGRFDKDFVEIDQISSGEFGKVLKVRSKNGPLSSDNLWAVKWSKLFEGPWHRLCLREEVNVLQHLCRAAATDGGHHPNVLTYIDSWEEDEVLIIRTELCKLGNFACFLWEYGKGLRFIHESGVIHLDLKPANIFLTQEGRFKIGDFGMMSLWPHTSGGSSLGVSLGGFKCEGDKVYLAQKVLNLQGTFGKATDIFRCFITTSQDMTARLFTLNPVEGFCPKTFAGHRDAVVGTYFSSKSNTIYTVSRDSAVFTWKAKTDQDMETDDDNPMLVVLMPSGALDTIAMTRWGVRERHYFNLPNTKVICTIFHPPFNLLVIGFSTGVFGLWEMPQFTTLHTLSIPQEKISVVAISPGGHILKRWARSRPISLKLLESVNKTPPSALSQIRFALSLSICCTKDYWLMYSLTYQVLNIDMHQSHHQLLFRQPIRIGSLLSTMFFLCQQATSYYPHRWLTGSSGPHPFLQIPNASDNAPCPSSTTHLSSSSSASLFFGPSIPQTTLKTRLCTTSNGLASQHLPIPPLY